MQKSMKKGKYIHNLTEINFQWETSPQAAGSHPKPCMIRGKNTRPSFSPSIFPSTLFTLPPCSKLQMAVWKWLSLLNQTHHLTIVRKMSCDLNVTHRAPSSHHAQSLVLHTPQLCESALQTFKHHSDYSVELLWVLDLSWWQSHLLEGRGSMGGNWT